MKKVLLITYFFPPLGGMSSLRMARFVRYLPEFGWQPLVLTVKNVRAGWPRDDGLLDSIPRNLVIYGVDPINMAALEKRLEKFNAGAVTHRLRKVLRQVPPDGELGVTWFLSLYLKARMVVAKESIDAILTSSLPCITHVTGYLLKKTTGIPWVADLQDEWSQHPHRKYRFYLQRRFDAWLEKQVMLTADHVTAATDAYVTALASLLPLSRRDHRFTTITNSYDASDMEKKGLLPDLGEQQCSNVRKFTITYVGTLYGGVGFFSALENLLNEGNISADDIQVVIVGKVYPLMQFDGQILKEKVAMLELKGVIQQVGWISHKDTIRYLKDTDVLLLVLDSNRGEATIPGKAFEYIACDKPILALVPLAGVAADLIRSTRTGVVVQAENVAAAGEAIVDFYQKWKVGNLHLEPDWMEIRKYDAKTLTRRLAAILNQISNHSLRHATKP